MNNQQKLKYQKDVETYLDEHNIYDLFEELMVQIVKSKPKDHLDFLINQLQKTKPIKIVIIGPPGSKAKEIALSIQIHLNIQEFLSVGDLLNKEIIKRSEYCSKIIEARKTYSNLSDDLILKIVKTEIDTLESSGNSYIIEGFPRNKIQANAFQSWGTFPDHFIVLKLKNEEITKRISFKLMSPEFANNNEVEYYPEYVDNTSKYSSKEIILNIEEAKKVNEGFYYEVDTNQTNDQILQDILRICQLKLNSNSPKRPPRIVILGPPGSGRSTQAEMISKKYKLVWISVNNLLKNEIAKKTATGLLIEKKMKEGELVPDEIINKIIEERLQSEDCRVNGWIMENFPKTDSQIEMLRNNNFDPTLFLEMQIDDDIIYNRLNGRRLDPQSGKIYDIKKNLPSDKKIIDRLEILEEDKHDILKKRIKICRSLMIKLRDSYSDRIIKINASKNTDIVSKEICEVIENPLLKPI